MNSVKASLTRKIGPLPAWVWLAFFAVAVVAYRRLKTKTDPTSTSGEVVDDTTQSRDPVTVAPGEGVYDPNTGQFKSEAPDQIKLDPITVEPGEAIYDPQTGKFIRNVDPKTHKKKKKKKPKKKPKHPHFGMPRTRDLHHPQRGKNKHPHGGRRKKHKPQHDNTHGKVARQPAAGATRPRGPATILNPAANVPTRAPAPKTPAKPTAMVSAPAAHAPAMHAPATAAHTATPLHPITPAAPPPKPQSATPTGAPRPRTTVNPTVASRTRVVAPVPPKAPVKGHPAAPAHAPAKPGVHHSAAPPAPKQKRR
jgi:hypothetical protein